MSEPELIKSPIAARVARDDQELVDIYGMGIPAVIDDPMDEYTAVREGVGLLDFSPLLKVDVEGPGAQEKLNGLHTRDVTKLTPGRIAYGAILSEDGLMIDDSTVMVRAADRVRVVGSPGMPPVVTKFAEANGLTATERRAELAHLNVQGPKSREVVARLTDEDFTNEGFPYYRFKDPVTIAGIDDVFVTRMGFTAELGYEFFVPVEHALDLYDALIEAGEPEGMRPVGVAAVMMVRIEAGMVMGDGLEYDETVSPWECGLGWAVDLDKGDFQGREATVKLKDERTDRLTSVVLDGGEDAATGAELSVDGKGIGQVTMAIPSPYLEGKTLGLAKVHRDYVTPGTDVSANVGGNDIAGKLVPTPVYDPERKRVKS
ncbi:MAG: aminomethyl transferase family protein [Solirubrobacterales bacterium]|nr:aminomethyl transferase family protein [Solirubrobacterales bacterium]